MERYECPCCGYFTFENKPDGNYDICPVCFWEDDPCAYEDFDEECCCNGVSLNQARRNFLEFGACCKEMVPNVKKNLSEKSTDRCND